MLKKFIYAEGQKFHALRNIELKYILRYLQPKKGEKILDVGCGKGYFCGILNSKGCICFGIDSSNKDIEIASKYQNKEIKFSIASAEKLPFKRSYFDKVVSVCVLEHVNDEIKALSEINRVLKKGDTFVASLDALSPIYYSERYRKFYAKEFKVNQFYDIQRVMKIFHKTGFKVISYRYVFSGIISSFLIKIFSYLHFRNFFILSFPIIYPLFYLENRFFNNVNGGFILIIKSIKYKD